MKSGGMLERHDERRCQLPAHQFQAEALKSNSTQTFREDVTKLLSGVNLLENYVSWPYQSPKSMVPDSIMLGAEGHPLWFQFS